MHLRGRSTRRRQRRAVSGVLQRFVLPAVLLSSWLAAQGLAISHDFDLERHPAHEICELCIAAGDLGSAAPGKGIVWAAEPVKAAVSPVVDVQVAARHVFSHRARGPPATSRV